jgi:hypothetical protein
MMNPRTESRRATKEAQICIRIPAFVDEWLQSHAKAVGSKADVVRGLIEREMTREEENRLRAMFDAAAAELTKEEKEDRDLLLGAFEAEGD